MKNLKYAVLGASNIDIAGISKNALTLHDSNIGQVKISSGGVGRNICENLARLGKKVSFFSAFAKDTFADFLQKELSELSIDFTNSYYTDKFETSSYLFVNDVEGEMYVAINDMILIESVPISYFEKILPLVNQHDVCVIDTNWPIEVFSFLMENVKIPICVDPVSLTKSEKCLPYLSKIHSFKPNLSEAQHLSKKRTLEDSAEVLLDAGVKQLFISLGSAGLYYATKDKSGIIPVSITKPVNTTGAGDATMAGIVAGFGMPIEDKAKIATRLAEICVMTNETVAKNLNNKIF
ncbi:MAG: MarR family transcriptional regulator [Treponema sp.]|nr:MAG: MarR family transcriptional regulator [Treponema sp.]